MEFALTSEQSQFRDTIRRLVVSMPLNASGASGASYGVAWKRFAELGVPGMCVAEDRGGFSGNIEDIALIAAEFGRSPTTTIRLETIVAAVDLLAAAGSVGEPWLKRLVAGETQPAVAAVPWEVGTLDLSTLGDGYTLSGVARSAIGGETADVLVAIARLSSGELAVIAVDLEQVGVVRTAYRLADTTPVADIEFVGLGVSGNCVARLADGGSLVEAVWQNATLALCAAAVGGMECAIELTVSFLKERAQFGKPLAQQQALQHQVADMFMRANDARSSLYRAMGLLSDTAHHQRASAIAGCRLKVGDAAKEVTGRALHLHGGIGFTTEYPVGHLFRRATVDDRLLVGRDACIAIRQRQSTAPVEVVRDKRPAALVA